MATICSVTVKGLNTLVRDLVFDFAREKKKNFLKLLSLCVVPSVDYWT